MFALLLIAAGYALQGQIIGLRAPGGEDDLLRVCSQELCHLLSGVLQSLFCLLAKAVQAGGIAELIGKVGQHGLQDLGSHGSGGRMVHVNPLHR